MADLCRSRGARSALPIVVARLETAGEGRQLPSSMIRQWDGMNADNASSQSHLQDLLTSDGCDKRRMIVDSTGIRSKVVVVPVHSEPCAPSMPAIDKVPSRAPGVISIDWGSS